jgi:hypothetical protein
LQAPQRGIIASSTAALAQAWKDKDMAKINRIYHRSSINQLIFAVGMFTLIYKNSIQRRRMGFLFHRTNAYHRHGHGRKCTDHRHLQPLEI